MKRVWGINRHDHLVGIRLKLYAESDGVEEIIVGDDGVEYAVCSEYALDGCHAKVFDDGRIRAVLPFDNTNDKLWVDIGCLDELRTKR